MDMKFETRQLSELYPAEYNPRVELKDGDPEYESLKKSIDELGYVEPMIINSDGTIIGGHQRYNVLIDLGFDEVPVIVLDVDKDRERAINVALNKIDGEWDEVKLKDVLTDIDFSGISLETVGFSQSEFDDLCLRLGDDIEAQEDDFDVDAALDAIKEPKSKRGDIYQLGRHRLMCGDSTDIDDVLNLIGDAVIDLVLTDPPYGIDIVQGTSVGGGGPTHFGTVDGGKIVPVNNYAPIIGDETTETARASYAVMKELSENQIIFGGNYFTDFLPPKSCWVVWDKENTGNFADCELAWTSFDKAAKLYHWLWNGLSRKGDRKSEGVSRIHPTQKPVGLMGEILKDFSIKGDSILDVFGGSGSTLMACEQLDRTCYMMELEPMYIDLIIDRWENYTGDKAVKL